jgi:hypothetical protein
MRKAVGMVLVAMMAAACAASTAVTEPPATVSPPPTSPRPTSTPSMSPSPSAIASPHESAAPRTLTIRWQADDPTGITPLSEPPVGVARSGETFVLIGEMPDRDESTPFAAWWSGDGKRWELAQEFAPDERILALAAGGPGYVAGGFDSEGATVWTSVDGRTWKPVNDPSLGRGAIHELVPTMNGIVAFGEYQDTETAGIWTSADGREWLAATNETGRSVARGLQAVGSYDGRAVALVDQGDPDGLAVWETTGRAEWTRTGTLPQATSVTRVAGGPVGWVAVGDNLAWVSPDGRAWSRAVRGPDVASDLIADASGYVAVGWVGSLPDETCGDQRPFAGHTWTSSDGRAWEQMPVGKEFKAAMVTHLIVVERTLIGYGLRIDSAAPGDLPVARWTAPLPDVTRSASASDKASKFLGCGG